MLEMHIRQPGFTVLADLSMKKPPKFKEVRDLKYV